MNRFVISSLLLMFSHVSLAVDMPLTAISGETENLQDYEGKWIVVNYWATWCPPCIQEMPELQAFHDKHAEKDAVVVGINSQQIGAPQLESFLNSYMIDYPVYMSNPSSQSELGSVPALPTTFLVSPEGDVVARQVGPVTGEMIESFIAQWKPE